MSNAIHQRFIDIAHGLSPALADAMTALGPLALQRRQEVPLAEALCRSVAGQQLSVKAARTIWGRVLESAGERPLIEHFAVVEPEELRARGLSMAKARTMRAIAEEARAGRLDAAELGALELQERTVRLTSIWGIGQWTADMMSIFYFGDEDVWPEGDVTARSTLTRLTSRRRKTVRTAQRFAPHRSYLALYMWRHADAAPG